MSDTAASSTFHSNPNDFADINLDLSNLISKNSKDEISNNLSVYCPRCPSLILRPNDGLYVESSLSLVDTRAKPKGEKLDQFESFRLKYFWRVDDIFTFENIGYTNTVDGRYKYLTCADCECGPLGVQILSEDDLESGLKKNSSYLALARVMHR